MKKILLTVNLLIFSFLLTLGQTPLSKNGRLKLVGNQLSNQCGSPVQLRGMSSHAIMAHSNCFTEGSVRTLATEWGADVIRLAVYTQAVGVSPGYQSDSIRWNNWIATMVDLAEANGMYAIIDWHILEDQNPNVHIEAAKKFFNTMARNFKNRRHVIYEIANEPNGSGNWNEVKKYANVIIPIIRRHDPEGIILVGTPEFSAKPSEAVRSPLTGANAYNVMYTFHFYAGSHSNYDELINASKVIPMFVSEWGTSGYSGNDNFSASNSTTWLNKLDEEKISWVNWSFSDKNEVSAALKPNACATGNFSDRSESGQYVYGKMRTTDQFVQCAGAADDDRDGVINSEDDCANTPTGTFVDAVGCPAQQGDADKDGVIDARDTCRNTVAGAAVNVIGCPLDHDFVSKVCMGFNNYEGYARSDFSIDSLANFEYWNRPKEMSPVYSAVTTGGKLVITVTNADPLYNTMGFSFGERYTKVGNRIDTTLIPLDLRANAIVRFKMKVTSNNYSASTVLVDVQLEDAQGNSISTDRANNLIRIPVGVNTDKTIVANFKGGALQSYDAAICGASVTPCYVRNFDFSRVTKVKLWINPGAGETWSRPAFNGTWTIDDFSIGYDTTSTLTCTTIRDDDRDGVKQELDLCPYTTGTNPDANGCTTSQLDTDKDGVMDDKDRCPNTRTGTIVDPATGCARIETSLNSDVTNGTLSIYPVPATDKLNIDQAVLKYTSATITDLSGNIVASKVLSGTSEEMSLTTLAKGTYFVKLGGLEKTEFFKIQVR